MHIIFYNIGWMQFNIALAVMAVLFGYFFIHFKKGPLHYLFGILWLLFLPNTIYMVTDIIHLLSQWGRVVIGLKLFLLIQYFFLELIALGTFLYGMVPLEKKLIQYKLSDTQKLRIIIGFNILIAFGIVLGRIERMHSWYVFTRPDDVLYAIYAMLTSPFQVGLFVLFALFCNLLYFLLRDSVIQIANITPRKKSQKK